MLHIILTMITNVNKYNVVTELNKLINILKLQSKFVVLQYSILFHMINKSLKSELLWNQLYQWQSCLLIIQKNISIFSGQRNFLVISCNASSSHFYTIVARQSHKYTLAFLIWKYFSHFQKFRNKPLLPIDHNINRN